MIMEIAKYKHIKIHEKNNKSSFKQLLPIDCPYPDGFFMGEFL